MSSFNLLHLNPERARALAVKLALLQERKQADAKGKAPAGAEDDDGSEVGRRIREVREEVLRKERELDEVKAKRFGMEQQATASFEEKRRSLLQLELHRLRIHVKHQRRLAAAPVPPIDPILREKRVAKLTADAVEVCGPLIESLKEELEAAKADLEREKNLFQESLVIRDGLRARKAEVDAKEEGLTEEQLISGAAFKLSALERHVEELMGEVQNVFNGNYDRPDEEDDEDDEDGRRGGQADIRKYFKSSGHGGDAETERRGQFATLLSELMNRSFESPADPWVDGKDHPREMGLFLLRAGIAVEHPTDARKWRLVDFHKTHGEM